MVDTVSAAADSRDVLDSPRGTSDRERGPYHSVKMVAVVVVVLGYA